MHAILLAWKNALDTLKPHRLQTLIISSFKCLGKGSYSFLKSFWWLLLADAGLFLLLGSYTATPKALDAFAKNHSLILLLVLFAQSILWFFTSTFFFLLVRREERADDYTYCAFNLIKYCQITMLPPLVLFLALYLLVSASGMHAFPMLSWTGLLCIKTVGLFVVLYWLDTQVPTLQSFLSAIERGINLCFYNLPLIALFVAIAMFADIGASKLIAKLFTQELPHLFMMPIPTALGTEATTLKGRLLILVVKYGAFIVELCWIAFIVSIYRRKRNEEYTTMFFS
jgi:hypothetical protein